MPNFRVTWEIDVEAGTPEQAAACALKIQRDPDSIATLFEVRMADLCPSCRMHSVHSEKCRWVKLNAAKGSGNPHLIGCVHRVDLSEKGER